MANTDELIAVDAESALKSLKELMEKLPEEQLSGSLVGRHFYVHPEVSDAINQLLAKIGDLQVNRAIWPPIKK